MRHVVDSYFIKIDENFCFYFFFLLWFCQILRFGVQSFVSLPAFSRSGRNRGVFFPPFWLTDNVSKRLESDWYMWKARLQGLLWVHPYLKTLKFQMTQWRWKKRVHWIYLALQSLPHPVDQCSLQLAGITIELPQANKRFYLCFQRLIRVQSLISWYYMVLL